MLAHIGGLDCLVEHGRALLQIRRIEPLGEPAIRTQTLVSKQ